MRNVTLWEDSLRQGQLRLRLVELQNCSKYPGLYDQSSYTVQTETESHSWATVYEGSNLCKAQDIYLSFRG